MRRPMTRNVPSLGKLRPVRGDAVPGDDVERRNREAKRGDEEEDVQKVSKTGHGCFPFGSGPGKPPKPLLTVTI